MLDCLQFENVVWNFVFLQIDLLQREMSAIVLRMTLSLCQKPWPEEGFAGWVTEGASSTQYVIVSFFGCMQHSAGVGPLAKHTHVQVHIHTQTYTHKMNDLSTMHTESKCIMKALIILLVRMTQHNSVTILSSCNEIPIVSQGTAAYSLSPSLPRKFLGKQLRETTFHILPLFLRWLLGEWSQGTRSESLRSRLRSSSLLNHQLCQRAAAAGN